MLYTEYLEVMHSGTDNTTIQKVSVCPPEKVLGRLLVLCINFLNKHVAVFTLY